MTIWTALLPTWRTWESSSEHTNKREIQQETESENLNTNLYCWTRPLARLNIKPDGIYVDGTLGGGRTCH